MAPPAHATTGAYLEGSHSTASFAVPAGVEADDIIVIGIYINAATSIATYPTGFSEAPDSPQINASGLAHNLHVVWKRATGADSGTYDFVLSTTDFMAGAAERFTGVLGTGSPWDGEDGTDGAVDTENGTDTPPVSVITGGDDRLILWFGASWSGGTWTPPAGYTERIDQGIGLVTAADKVQAAAGSSGDIQGTTSLASRRTAWAGALIPEVVTVAGVLGGTAAVPVASTAVSVSTAGSLTGTTNPVTASSTGAVIDAGRASAVVPMPAATITGGVSITGTITGSAPLARTAAAVQVSVAGQMNVAAPLLAAVMTSSEGIPWPPTAGEIALHVVATGVVTAR